MDHKRLGMTRVLYQWTRISAESHWEKESTQQWSQMPRGKPRHWDINEPQTCLSRRLHTCAELSLCSCHSVWDSPKLSPLAYLPLSTISGKSTCQLPGCMLKERANKYTCTHMYICAQNMWLHTYTDTDKNIQIQAHIHNPSAKTVRLSCSGYLRKPLFPIINEVLQLTTQSCQWIHVTYKDYRVYRVQKIHHDNHDKQQQPYVLERGEIWVLDLKPSII